MVNSYPKLQGVNTFAVKNVSEALYVVKQALEEEGVEVDTRNGKALEFPVPCAITYNNPLERVLFYPERDANPIFHFMESLWMLAGRNDVKWIQNYNKRMNEYSDDGEILQGAYGYRWRYHFNDVYQNYDKEELERNKYHKTGKWGHLFTSPFFPDKWCPNDQIGSVIWRLKEYPNDRRAVLTMWDPKTDLTRGNHSKDLPCNTHIYFSLRDNKLNMTVCNRSNDMIWGALGANAVHMSYLLEYIAWKVHAEVGTYTQFTNNLHAYVDTLQKLDGMQPDYDAYAVRSMKPMPMVSDNVNERNEFDSDLDKFIRYASWNTVNRPDLFDDLHMTYDPDMNNSYRCEFFRRLAYPMQQTWLWWKRKEYQVAWDWSEKIKPDDWCVAVQEWLMRRGVKNEGRN